MRNPGLDPAGLDAASPEGIEAEGLRPRWEILAARRRGSAVLYQTPQFFDYLRKIKGPETLDLLVTRDDATDQITGVVPMEKLSWPLPFSVGGKSVIAPRLPAIKLLGSEPLIAETAPAHDGLIGQIAQRHPDAAIIMDEVGFDGFLWRYLFSSATVRQNYFVYVPHGVRDCHVVHIPASLETHEQRLTKKVRYNLKRQERLLERHLGEKLTLTLITSEQQVPALLAALKALEKTSGRKDPESEGDLRASARFGLLYCSILTAGKRVIGVTRGTKFNDIYRLHYFHHDQSLARLSPGTTLWKRVLHFLIEDGLIKTVDMGYGTPAYRYERTNSIYRRGRVLLLRRTLANYSLARTHGLFNAGVEMLKTVTPKGRRPISAGP